MANMLRLPDQIYLLLFLLLGIIFVITMLRVKKQGGELFGKPTINLYAQLFSKFALIFPAFIFLLSILGINITRCALPFTMEGAGTFLFIIAMALLYLSLWHLGRFTKMGLPKNDGIQLQTSGIYRLSRNPMYLGLMLLAISSTMMTPNVMSIILTFAGIALHHRIILREEAFLEEKLGEQYREYKRRTRRYF